MAVGGIIRNRDDHDTAGPRSPARQPEPAPADSERRGARLPEDVLAAGNQSAGRLLEGEPGEPGTAGLALLAASGAGNAAAVRLQRSTAGAGTALPPGLRESAERSFAADFSDVRVHRDPDAQAAARQVSAKAFTVGSDIYFAAGHYDPDSTGGRHLLGHELTHVTQQTTGAAPAGDSSPLNQSAAPAEKAADAAGEKFARGEPAAGPPPAGPGPIGFIPLDGRQISSDPDTAKRQLLEIALKDGVQAARQVEFGLRLRRADLGLDRPPLAPEEASGMIAESAAYAAVIAALQGELKRWTIFEQIVEQQARTRALGLLELSEKRVAAERDRYGLTKTQDYIPTELGPAPVDTYGMAANPATAALAAAAHQLLDALTPLQEATRKLEAIQVDDSPPSWEFDTGLRPEAPDPVALAAAREQVRLTQERYLLLRNEKETAFPVLASFAAYQFLHTYELKGVRRNLETVGRGTAGGDRTAMLVSGDVFEKLENIAKVRAALTDGSLSVWGADNLIDMTKVGLGVAPGSLENKIIDQKVADDHSDRMLRDIFIGVFAMALGLIAAPLTGGGSLAAAAGVAATAGSAGLTATLAIQHVQEYQLAKAANATDFDKARVISSADPSLFWLALDVVLAGIDVSAAAMVFTKLTPLARQAVRASGQEATTALDALEKAADADAPALGRSVRQAAEKERGLAQVTEAETANAIKPANPPHPGDLKLQEITERYELLGDKPPRINIANNDDTYEKIGAHTVDRHGPDIALPRDPNAASKTIEGRIYGDAPWKREENWSYQWIDEPTMTKTVRDYVRENWETIRSDLALAAEHESSFDVGHLVGRGYYNSGMTGIGPRAAQYGETSLVRIRIKLVPGSHPPVPYVVTAFPAGIP